MIYLEGSWSRIYDFSFREEIVGLRLIGEDSRIEEWTTKQGEASIRMVETREDLGATVSTTLEV